MKKKGLASAKTNQNHENGKLFVSLAVPLKNTRIDTRKQKQQSLKENKRKEKIDLLDKTVNVQSCD